MKQREIQIPSFEAVEEERNRLGHKREYKRALRSTVLTLVVVAAFASLLATLFMPVMKVTGTSMEPTLSSGNIVVLWNTKDFQVGDLCGFYYQNEALLKRIIGRPGDYITVDSSGNVYVNDVLLDEPYITEKALGECDIEFPYQVPENKFFVMGDHRATSIDSRSSVIGCVDKSQMIGKIVCCVWPLAEFTMLD